MMFEQDIERFVAMHPDSKEEIEHLLNSDTFNINRINEYTEAFVADYSFSEEVAFDVACYYQLMKEAIRHDEQALLDYLLTLQIVTDNLAIREDRLLRLAVNVGNLAAVERFLTYPHVIEHIPDKIRERKIYSPLPETIDHHGILDVFYRTHAINEAHPNIFKKLLECEPFKQIIVEEGRDLLDNLIRCAYLNKENQIFDLYASVIRDLLTVEGVKSKITTSTRLELEELGITLQKAETMPKTFKSRLEHFKGDIPEDFLCPISFEIMNDPVTLTSGATCDRESIKEWFIANGNPDHLPCPITKNREISISELNNGTNSCIKNMIEKFVSKVELAQQHKENKNLNFFQQTPETAAKPLEHSKTPEAPHEEVDAMKKK